MKVGALSKESLAPQTSLPFDGIESRFLIGVSFRFILRDIIFCSQQRHDRGVLHHPIRALHRAGAYEEILRYSYRDYLRNFVIPYYCARGINLSEPAILEKASSLRSYAAALQGNARVRLIVNRDDFLLPAEDLAWFESVIPPERLTVFEHGGHLGNLSHPAVRRAIQDSLAGLVSSEGGAPVR